MRQRVSSGDRCWGMHYVPNSYSLGFLLVHESVIVIIRLPVATRLPSVIKTYLKFSLVICSCVSVASVLTGHFALVCQWHRDGHCRSSYAVAVSGNLAVAFC